MNVAVIGATGKTGQRVALTVRSPCEGSGAQSVEVQSHKNVSVVTSDLSDTKKIAGALKGADVVVSAYGAPADDAPQVISVARRRAPS